MTFDQEVRDYLEEVDRRPRTLEPVLQRHIDASALREHFLERLRELERGDPPDPHRIVALFREWSPKLPRFARYLEALPRQDAPTDDEKALAFARDALDVALNRLAPAISLVDRLELTRIVAGFDRPDPIRDGAS